MRNAQVSLELLIVTLVFLSMLAIWLAGASKVQASAEEALDAQALKVAADRLAGTVNSVCLMGHGNNRSLTVFFPSITEVSFNGNLSVGRFNRSTYCDVLTGFTAEGSLDVHAENVNGTVMLQPLEPLSDSQAPP
jgi:hypothetical protein